MARILALDMGAHSIKVVSYRTSARSYELEKRLAVSVPQDSALPTREARLAALDALLDENPEWKEPGNQVVALWPADQATFRRVLLPFTDVARVEKTLPFAIESEVPFDLDDMLLGWRVAQTIDKATGEKNRILSLMAKKESVKTFVEDLGSRNLDPMGIYVDGDLAGYYGSVGKVVAIIDIGHAQTVASVVKDKQVLACRAISVAGHAFTRAIQEALGCSWAEAEAIKHGDRLADDEDTDPGQRPGSGYSRLPPPAKEAVDAWIGQLLAEIRSMLVGVEDEFGVGVEEIRVTGGSSRIQEIWGYLASDLGVSVSPATDHLGKVVGPRFAAAQAGAMRGLRETSGSEIDLRLGELAFSGGSDIVKSVLLYGFVGTTLYAMASIVLFGYQYWNLRQEDLIVQEELVTTARQVFPNLPDNIAGDPMLSISELTRETASVTERADIVGDGGLGIPPVTDALLALTQAFPPPDQVKVNVTDLQITAKNLSLTAEADGYSQSDAVEKALQASERFKRAKKGDERKNGQGGVVFPINIPLVDTDEEG